LPTPAVWTSKHVLNPAGAIDQAQELAFALAVSAAAAEPPNTSAVRAAALAADADTI
jgi:hypothetical protein